MIKKNEVEAVLLGSRWYDVAFDEDDESSFFVWSDPDWGFYHEEEGGLKDGPTINVPKVATEYLFQFIEVDTGGKHILGPLAAIQAVMLRGF